MVYNTAALIQLYLYGLQYTALYNAIYKIYHTVQNTLMQSIQYMKVQYVPKPTLIHMEKG